METTKEQKVNAIKGLVQTTSDYAELGHKMYQQVIDFVNMFGGESKRINTFPCVANHNTQNKFAMTVQYVVDECRAIVAVICAVEVNDDQITFYTMGERDFDCMIANCEDVTDEMLDELGDMGLFSMADDLAAMPTLYNVLSNIHQFVEWQVQDIK